MIKQIDYIDAYYFYKREKKKYSVSISEKGNFYGYYDNGYLKGIISTQMIGKFIRIKSFLVSDMFKGEGIGTKLFKHVFYEFNQYSAFATNESINIFLKHGFKKVSQTKKNITYVKHIPESSL